MPNPASLTRTATLALAFLALAPPALAELRSLPVTDGVWAIVGDKGQRSAENLGNNATFGLIETRDGAILIDAGGSYLGAEHLHTAIRAVTDLPVTLVINTGGQDHRWLGNGYWAEQGARIVAAEAAVEDQEAHASMQMTMLSQLIGEGLAGTEPAYATETFAERLDLTIGGQRIEIVHSAPAHTPGDAFVWLPEERVAFAGDIVFTERLLGVLEFSRSAGWVEAFEAMAALDPLHVVPGHGEPTTLERAQADTYDYLVNLRGRMGGVGPERGALDRWRLAPPAATNRLAGMGRGREPAARLRRVWLDGHHPGRAAKPRAAAFEAAAREVGFLGFGFYPRSGFIHVNLGPARQWGERFPVRETAFAEETPPAREVLADSRTMKGGGAAGVATLGAAGVEVAQSVLAETQSAILPLVPYLDTLRWVFIAVALGGIAVTIYARLDDWRRGRR